MTDKNISTEYTGLYAAIFPNRTPRDILQDYEFEEEDIIKAIQEIIIQSKGE